MEVSVQQHASESVEITRWLLAWKEGDEAARERFVAAVYQELRKLARHYLRDERTNHTLQTDALINEAFLRLIEPSQWRAENRKQFFGLAAEVMRHVLVDWARQRGYQKRAGLTRQAALDEALTICVERSAEIIALDEALDRLSRFDPRLSRVVELKYFGGLGNKEAADVMGLSAATVKRDWQTAKTWLYRQLKSEQEAR